MKRFKGTKGEWGTMFIKNGTQRAVRGEGGIIAEMWKPLRYSGQDERYERELTETKANAQLMSKSKELLKSTIELSDKVSALMEQMSYKQQDIDGCLYQYKKLIKEATEI